VEASDASTHGHTSVKISQQTFQLPTRWGAYGPGTWESPPVSGPSLAAAVDWNDVAAVRLLGVALGILLLIWAIRSMFGGRRR